MNIKNHLNTAFILIAANIALGAFNLYQLLSVQGNIAEVNTKVEDQASTTKQMSTLAEGGVVQVVQKTQDELLTEAVAKTAPAVVSIVISKDVSQLEVSYENPFENNSILKNLNLKIPVYHKKSPSLEKVGAGSGFLISKNGYIVTNKHVVSEPSAEYTILLSDGTQKTGQVIYRDPGLDVAVLKIDGNYPVVANIGDSSKIKLGQTVVAIGDALGEYNNTVSVGIISGLNRSIQASDSNGNVENLTGIMQTDAAINLGNSGGPLIDLNGEVIGINVATIYGSNNINFSIPINMVKSAISEYR